MAAENARGGQTSFAGFGRLTVALLVAFCALFCAVASAQVQMHFAGAQIPLFTGLNAPGGVETGWGVGGTFTIFIADTGNKRVLMEKQ
jgi:hypothetical protein